MPTDPILKSEVARNKHIIFWPIMQPTLQELETHQSNKTKIQTAGNITPPKSPPPPFFPPPLFGGCRLGIGLDIQML
jgi:hypothetical protein